MTESPLYKIMTAHPFTEATDLLNDTPSNETSQPAQPSDHNERTRIVALWVLFVVGVIGNLLAFYWLWLNHRRKSRVNKIILGLALADLMVCIFTMLFSVAFVMNGYRWTAGNGLCKVIMHLQSTSMMASSNMLVTLAIDRHQAVRSPLKEAFSVNKMIMITWTFATLLSVPQLFVWRLKYYGPDFPTCGTNLRETPRLRLLYITYAAVVTFFIPFIIITIAYMRITKKIWDKARENKEGKRYSKKGKMRITSTGTSLNRAKHKTLKMSAAIISLFGICGLPYFLIEILKTLEWLTIDPNLYAIFGIFSASNSSINPYIFLWFNSGGKYCRALIDAFSKLCCDCIEYAVCMDRPTGPDYRGSTSSSHDNTLRSELEWKSTAVKTDYRAYDDKDYDYSSMPLHTIKEEPGESIKQVPKKVVKKYDYP